jgi:putative nucleotidyltransferase with HDIG domain
MTELTTKEKHPDWVGIFSKELALIKDEELKAKVVTILVTEVTDRHSKEAASSTGKYHPDFANGEGGLVRHIKAVVLITEELCRARPDLNHDVLIAAAILHDMRKYEGVDPYTKHEHPVTMAALCYQYNMPSVGRLIESHMGIWTTARNSSVELPKPEKDDEWLLHYADYIASRKWLVIKEL